MKLNFNEIASFMDDNEISLKFSSMYLISMTYIV
jgi:hypothetical protein